MPVVHVIVGSGFAGLKAAETIRQLDPQASVIIVTEETDLPYWRPRLPDVVGNKVSPEKILIRSSGYLAEHGIEVRLGQRVTAVAPKENRLTLSDGSWLTYDQLLLATGSLARRPGKDIPGSDFAGVIVMRSLADARDIAAQLDGAECTAVVGGGLLGIEMVRAFRERGNAVTYFMREDRFWPAMLDATAASMVESRLTERGVELRHGELIKEIKGEGGKVTSIVTTRDQEMPCQVVGYAIGAIPATGLLVGSDVKVDKGIMVDDKLRTNITNIYAAGDVAQALDLVHGDYRVATSVANAQAQGEVAGSNMAGVERSFRGVVPSNTMQIYGISFTCMGIAIPPGPGFEEITGPYPRDGVYKKLVLKDGKLVGAMLLGEIDEAKTAQELIARGADLSAVKDRLFTEGFQLRQLA
jgi:nitrite reductase (NADH) large subunit